MKVFDFPTSNLAEKFAEVLEKAGIHHKLNGTRIVAKVPDNVELEIGIAQIYSVFGYMVAKNEALDLTHFQSREIH